jgi:hypothetical protein
VIARSILFGFSPPSAWEHVYRLLLRADQKTGLAQCYESDKSQPLPPEALAALKQWDAETAEVEREKGIIIRLVFHRDGKPVRDFYAAWKSACKRAGSPGMLLHDLRRTAARNYVRSGNHESVVIRILGHKTRSIFDRYNIVAEEDLRQAADRVAAPRIGSKMGAIADIGAARRKADAR